MLSLILIIIGLFFFISGALGIWRLPDPLSRLHAGGLGDTLGLGCLLLALILHQQDLGLTVKFFFLGLMVIIINPVITHLVASLEYKDISGGKGGTS